MKHLSAIAVVWGVLSSAVHQPPPIPSVRESSEVESLKENYTKRPEPRILAGTSGNVSELRLSFPDTDYGDNVPIPTSIDVLPGSTLYTGSAGDTAIYFKVTNNLGYPIRYGFGIENGQLTSAVLTPRQATVGPQNSLKVVLRFSSTGQLGTGNVITFVAAWTSPNGAPNYVRKKLQIYSGYTSDTSSPDIWYEYQGDCSWALNPTKCRSRTWSARVHIRDSGSGLLDIISDPPGLVLDQEFIVGTRNIVDGTYTASCCHPRVDISAVDVLGHTYVRFINVENEYLSPGDIAAIVLGCILFCVIVAAVIWLTIWCCRKRRTLTVYSS